MPTSVESAYAAFLTTLRSSAKEVRSASSHRSSIDAVLRSKFGMTDFFRSGSFGRATSISGHSDADYFAVVPRDRVSVISSTVLAHVATALRERYPQTPNIRVDSPGVRLPFGIDEDELTEVIPAIHVGTYSGYRVFDIPDGADSWMKSSPDYAKATTQAMDDRFGGKFKPLVRFVKAWKFYRDVPISSFYLEAVAMSFMSTEQALIYDIDVKNVLQKLWDSQLRPITNPGVGGLIFACKTDSQLQLALQRLGIALSWAQEAVANREANARQAIDRWSHVFNHNFPSYG